MIEQARHALRALVRSPLFALVAVVMLAVGIGASTAVFSVVNRVLLEPLPYPEAGELVAVWHSAPGAGIERLPTSASMYFTYTEHNETFEHFGVWGAGRGNVTGIAAPEEVRVVRASDGLLQALGVPALHGRWLSAADQEPGANPVIMLSYEYWQSRFGGDPAAVGRSMIFNEQTFEIVGVMPRGFRVADTPMDVILPFSFDRSQLRLPTFDFSAIGRLKPGITIEQANGDIARMIPIWLDSWPAFPGGEPQFYVDVWKVGPALTTLKQDVVGNIGNVLWVVMGTIGLVLVIACANVANLLLVRAQGRERELAVRAALGAGSWRIARGLLIESVLLGAAGGLLGLVIAQGLLQLLIEIGPANLPRMSEIALDGRALAFGLSAALLAGALLGAIPALRFAGPRIGAALQSGGRAASHGRDRHRAQNMLVVVQVALALVLLVSAGLMIRSFEALRTVDPGFSNAEELQTFRISIPQLLVPEAERVIRMQHDIVDALAAIPSVRSAAFASSVPMDGINIAANGVQVEGMPSDSASILRRFEFVSPGAFATTGTRIVAGRDITWAEVHDLRPLALVSENLARELWGTPEAALGARIAGLSFEFFEVIGVVQDIRDNGIDAPAPAIVYWPSYRVGNSAVAPAAAIRAVTMVVRSPLAGTPGFMADVHRAVWSVNPNLPVASVRTMQDIYAASLARTTFTLIMLAAAGGAALVLGVVGLYGVLSYAVAQRRREIAIRMALGAQERAVRRQFVRYGVALAAIGIACGLAAALGVTRLMASLLYEVQPFDVPTYAAVAAGLVLVAALASYVPARRASGVAPAEALAED